MSKMDIDAMSPDELKQTVRELLKQKEEADATIASRVGKSSPISRKCLCCTTAPRAAFDRAAGRTRL